MKNAKRNITLALTAIGLGTLLGFAPIAAQSYQPCVDDPIPCELYDEIGSGCSTGCPPSTAVQCCRYTQYRCNGTQTVFRKRSCRVIEVHCTNMNINGSYKCSIFATPPGGE